MPTAIHRQIRQIRNNELPTLVARLSSGWVVAGDVQWLPGYCVLLADPVVPDYNSLSEPLRAQYALDMGLVGDALLNCLGAYRINYETWCNLTPALHTHIVPRFMSEVEPLRVLPPRQAYDWNAGRPFCVDKDKEWMNKVGDYLRLKMKED